MVIRSNSLCLTFLFCSFQNHLRMKTESLSKGGVPCQSDRGQRGNRQERQGVAERSSSPRALPNSRPGSSEENVIRTGKTAGTKPALQTQNAEGHKLGQGLGSLAALALLSPQTQERKFILDRKIPCLCFWNCQVGLVQSAQPSALELGERVSILRQEQ